MQKYIMLLLLAACCFLLPAAAAEAAPAYAKWGNMAVLETQKKYEADIVDYQHIGRHAISPEVAEEQFKLWVRRRESGKEFGVYVNIRFNPVTDTFQSIRFIESNR